MRTHDFLDDRGRLLSFEVSNTFIGRRGLVRVVAGIPGARIIKAPAWFSWPEDEFCEFECGSALFSATEPFGDNSRYLIAPKPPRWIPETELVRDTFRAVRFAGLFLWRSPSRVPDSKWAGPRLVVLLDESCLIVYPSVEAAILAIEAIDIERELRAAFDETGIPYRVERLRPNRHGSFSVTNGAYRLVPAGPRDPASLLALMAEHPSARTEDGDEVDLAELTLGLRAV